MSSSAKQLSLTDSSVQAVRDRYESAHGSSNRKIRLSFDELFECFQNTEIRHTVIAERAGVTRENIRRLYQRYFAALFKESPRDRYKSAATQQRQTTLQNQIKFEPKLKELVRSALGVNCSVSATIRRGRYLCTSLLTINGYKCDVHCSDCIRTIKGRRYLAVCITRSISCNHAFVICTLTHNDCTRIWIIPSSLINKCYLQNRHRITLNIPIDKRPVYRNCLPRIPWGDYENAWHLLRPSPETD